MAPKKKKIIVLTTKGRTPVNEGHKKPKYKERTAVSGGTASIGEYKIHMIDILMIHKRKKSLLYYANPWDW